MLIPQAIVQQRPVGGWAARSSDSVFVSNDDAWVFSFTASFTQTFSSAANLFSGWSVYLVNDSGSTVTLDPAGAETIDGAATYVMSADEALMVVCDGSAFHTVPYGAGGSSASQNNLINYLVAR